MADLLNDIARRRDKEAFRKLYAAYGPRVKAFMMRKGASDELAEDLAQETLLAVWRKAALYSADKGSATTWIFTIARNLRIDRLRREVVWQELPGEAEEVPSDETLPDESVSLSQRQSRVRAEMATLPPEQQQVLTMAFVDGLSHVEIADRLGLPLGTVKSRIRLAYEKIRAALEDLR